MITHDIFYRCLILKISVKNPAQELSLTAAPNLCQHEAIDRFYQTFSVFPIAKKVNAVAVICV